MDSFPSKVREPWKVDTNNKYSEVVKSIMGLATASVFLPVFLAREFLGIESEIPLKSVLGCSVYWSWALLAASILAGVFFIYLSAKWVRIAWGKEAGILWSSNTRETTVECLMEISFWLSVVLFCVGIFLTIWFFATYEAA